jgi:hypothetical protein
MDPDPLVRGTGLDPDPSIIKLLYDFLSLKNDVNVPSKVISKKTRKNGFLLASYEQGHPSAL